MRNEYDIIWDLMWQADIPNKYVFKVKEALEKADKYRWHDLRNDPNDLPKADGDYWIYGLFSWGKSCEAEMYYSATLKQFEKVGDFTVIAWREIDRFKEAT